MLYLNNDIKLGLNVHFSYAIFVIDFLIASSMLKLIA